MNGQYGGLYSGLFGYTVGSPLPINQHESQLAIQQKLAMFNAAKDYWIVTEKQKPEIDDDSLLLVCEEQS